MQAFMKLLYAFLVVECLYLHRNHKKHLKDNDYDFKDRCNALTLSQTTNFRPFQTEKVCRRQF